MGQFDDVKAFTDRAKRLNRLDDLGALLSGVVEELGFDFHALGHHVDLRLPPENAIRLINYPQGWFDLLVERRYYVDDPVLMMAQRSATGFFWSDVPVLMPLTARQKAILNQAPNEGLGPGYTVPVHVPGEYSGSINFAVRPGVALPEASLPAAQYVGTFAFEAARRVQLGKGQVQRTSSSSLSPRQRDCIILVAQGRSDKDIARRLGIQPHTAHGYVEQAMQHYGTTKRTQMVVRALFEGDIAFADVINAPP